MASKNAKPKGRTLTKSRPPMPKNVAHSPDFASMRWGPYYFVFTSMQGAIVRQLFEALLNGTPEVRGCTLLERAGSKMKGDRIAPIFQGHPAWRVLIVAGEKRGTYRLNCR